MKKVIIILAIVAGFILACFVHSEIEMRVAERHAERVIENIKEQQEIEQEQIRQAQYDNEARLLDSLKQVGLY